MVDGVTCRGLLHLEGLWWKDTRHKHEALLNSFAENLNMSQRVVSSKRNLVMRAHKIE